MEHYLTAFCPLFLIFEEELVSQLLWTWWLVRLGAEWSDSWRTSLQSLKCCSWVCPLLWINHSQSHVGKGKGRIINFVQFFLYCGRGYMGSDYSTCVQCLELIIKSLCLVMVFFHIIKFCVFVDFGVRKPRLAYQFWMPWWRRREKREQSPLHSIAVPMIFSLFFVCFG